MKNKKKLNAAVTKEGAMVKPFTFEDMTIVNEQLMKDYTAHYIIDDNSLIRYVYNITSRYASLSGRLDSIKRIDQVIDNKAIYQFFYTLKEFSDKPRRSGMHNMFWYVFYSMYLHLVHNVYSLVAYEFNIDGKSPNHEAVKQRFFDLVSSKELRTRMVGIIYTDLSLDSIARCIMDNIGEDIYMSLCDKEKLAYFYEYTKSIQAMFTDACTSFVTELLLDALFNTLLYNEDMSGAEYQKIADSIVPIINDFREDLYESVGDLIGIFTLDYISPINPYYFYDEYY